DDRVAATPQLRHERSADSSARAGDKHSHLYLLARIPAARPVALLTCEVVIRAELVSIQVCQGLCFSLHKANAGAHLLPEAGATQEGPLEAVRCSARLCENAMFW